MMTSRYLKDFKKHGLKFSKAIDEFGRWLNENRPPNLSEECVESFLEILTSTGEGFLEFTKLLLISHLGEEEKI